MPFILIIILTMFMNGSDNNAVNSDVLEARIETRMVGNILQVKNVFENNSSQQVSLRYKFRCARKSASGTAVSSQSGGIKAAPGEKVSLSQTSMSVNASDTYTLSLEIYEGDQQVAHDTVIYPE